MAFQIKEVFDTITSTNQYAKDHIDTFKHEEAVAAFQQTKGKGRHDHIWISPKGNLYVSFVLKNKKLYTPFELVMRTSLALVTLLEELDCGAWIKYPNDIMVHQKKIAGVLIEQRHNIEEPFSIIGIGLNVNQGVFPTLQSRATSLLIETDEQYELDSILIELCKVMDKAFELSNEDVLSMYNVCLQLPKHLEYEGKTYQVNRVNIDGELILQEGVNERKIPMDAITLENTYETYNT